jgi:hypothetical protein
MCEPISIGIAIGASVGAIGAAATGGDPLMGALMGGIGGGFAGAGAGMFGNMATNLALGVTGTGVATGTAVGMAAGVIGGVTSTLGGVAMNMLTPQTPDYSQFGYGAQPYEPQRYSSQHAQVTGSGGRQAAAVLASEIKQAKSLRKRQAEVADYGLGMSVAGTGLQIA